MVNKIILPENLHSGSARFNAPFKDETLDSGEFVPYNIIFIKILGFKSHGEINLNL